VMVLETEVCEYQHSCCLSSELFTIYSLLWPVFPCLALLQSPSKSNYAHAVS